MKAILITVGIIETIQIISLFAIIMTDGQEGKQVNKMIQSKRDVLKFFIPFFWFIPMLNMILGWWNNLK